MVCEAGAAAPSQPAGVGLGTLWSRWLAVLLPVCHVAGRVTVFEAFRGRWQGLSWCPAVVGTPEDPLEWLMRVQCIQTRVAARRPAGRELVTLTYPEPGRFRVYHWPAAERAALRRDIAAAS